jgi:hypothetical protein
MQSDFSLFLLDGEPYEFCSWSSALSNLFQCISYSFFELFQSFRPYIKVFNPFWVDFVIGWETGF